MKRACCLLVSALILCLGGAARGEGFVNDLRARGYTLIPSPQKMVLQAGDVVLDGSWQVVSNAGDQHIAARSLRSGAEQLHRLVFSGTGPGRIVLGVAASTVKEPTDPELSKQAYRLTVAPGKVEITGNSDAGLFYGVQSLLQLLKADGMGHCLLPAGTITDWPDLQLRFLHWDTKHHQDRPETLKRFLDWSALFKANAIGFEIEDKYEYPRHPIIGAPGAFTKAEMQELTRYALERFIELVPDVQSPAHFAYVLKHPEFAHLRADSSNYQACMCDEEAIKLIQDMYQDMIDATPGVKYFLVSTDEVYYAGICDKCQKKRPYNEVNRSQAWVDYVNRMHAWLDERGRRMICWVEYPILTEHILQLPPDLIDGVMGNNAEFLRNEKKVGIRQLAYSSTQGGELLFPNHFGSTSRRGRVSGGRMEDISQTVVRGLAAGADPIGTFAAAWDDSGLHNETFWLGWATVTQYGWTSRAPSVEQSVADFMDVFYGSAGSEMTGIYRKLISGARFFESHWDRVTSTERPSGYGNSNGKGVGTRRSDATLETPALPSDPNLAVEPNFSTKYKEVLAEAREQKAESNQLIQDLAQNLTSVSRNHYNLEVLLSIAHLERHFIDMLLGLESVESSLVSASSAASQGNARQAVGMLVSAHNTVSGILEDRADMWKKLKAVWEKSRYPKGRSVGGRDYLHIMDDVKDHSADRRPGLEYMIAPFERMKLEQWEKDLAGIINKYAADHNVPVRGLAEPRLED